MRKTVFTTGEAAKICQISQQTIIRCFDNGTLKGFRVPGSKFRRIPWGELYVFMKDNDIPLEWLVGNEKSVLIISGDDDYVLRHKGKLETNALVSVSVAMSGFDAGMRAKELRPDLSLIDSSIADASPAQICRRFRGDKILCDHKIVCTLPAALDEESENLCHAGADEVILEPIDGDELYKLVCSLLEVPQEDSPS